MKKSIVMLTGTALLLTFSASAKMNVTKYAITIDEPVTAQNTAAALAEFQKTGGKNPTITLAQCDDAGLAAAVKTFPNVTKLTIRKSPKLQSIAALSQLKLVTLSLNRLPKMEDLSPVGSIKTLQNLTIDEVGFKNPDLSFCSGLTNLRNFSLASFPVSLKSISGIDKCAKITQLSFRRNQGPLDLSPLANFKTLRRISLHYVSNLDLSPVAKMPMLTDLSLYGSKNLDLAPLAGCPKLKYIMIYATKGIKDYADLAKIKTLETVNAGLTPMRDLSWAPLLPNLKRLDLFAEHFDSYAPLGQCGKLENLTFWSMRGVVDIAQFANGSLPLKKLSFSGSSITGEAQIPALAKAGKLTSLNLEDVNKGKKAIDISFLKSIPTLQELNLRKAQVSNLDVVTQLPNLKKITIDKKLKTQLEGKLNGVRISAY